MSDDEDSYSDNNSESDHSENEHENENENNLNDKKSLFKPSIKIKSLKYAGDDSGEEDDDDDDDDDSEIEDDDDDADKIGGAEDEEEVADNESESDSDLEIDENGDPVVVNKLVKQKKTQLVIQNEDEDDEDDNEFDENYLQKFDSDIIKNYVHQYHPECLSHNYEEIAKLAIVVKNSDGIIIDPLHKTIPYLTKYEKARILGQRAKQIESGAKPLIKVPENIVDSYLIAELELREKKIPFIIRRPIPGGACEYWKINDLEYIAF
jgi:DNA-directed RNA polymerase I, II, and III subunit RPABC2